MVARTTTVHLVLDVAPFVRALKRAAAGVARVFYTPGDRHIESIVRDCLDRRLPVDVTARRLMVASDIAQLLDADRGPTPCEALARFAAAMGEEPRP